MMRAQFFSERLLIFAATERDRFKSHLSRVLHAEMTESTDPLDRNDIAAARP